MRFLAPEWHARLPSTNTALLERLKRGEALPSGFVLVAREQTAGRGRLGRRWVSGPGRDLTCSLLIRTRTDPQWQLSLPMAAALGVATALDRYEIRAQAKWPNDLWAGGRKICGILTERNGDALVIGIGLNVNMGEEEAAAIDRPATSMRLETGRIFAVEAVLGQLLRALPPWIDRWERGGFAALQQAWTGRCVGLGERLSVTDGEWRLTGVLEGFGVNGQLLLRQTDGSLREVWTGDVEP